MSRCSMQVHWPRQLEEGVITHRPLSSHGHPCFLMHTSHTGVDAVDFWGWWTHLAGSLDNMVAILQTIPSQQTSPNFSQQLRSLSKTHPCSGFLTDAAKGVQLILLLTSIWASRLSAPKPFPRICATSFLKTVLGEERKGQPRFMKDPPLKQSLSCYYYYYWLLQSEIEAWSRCVPQIITFIRPAI